MSISLGRAQHIRQPRTSHPHVAEHHRHLAENSPPAAPRDVWGFPDQHFYCFLGSCHVAQSQILQNWGCITDLGLPAAVWQSELPRARRGFYPRTDHVHRVGSQERQTPGAAFAVPQLKPTQDRAKMEKSQLGGPGEGRKRAARQQGGCATASIPKSPKMSKEAGEIMNKDSQLWPQKCTTER